MPNPHGSKSAALMLSIVLVSVYLGASGAKAQIAPICFKGFYRTPLCIQQLALAARYIAPSYADRCNTLRWYSKRDCPHFVGKLA